MSDTIECSACQVRVPIPSAALNLLRTNGRITCSFACPACGQVSADQISPNDLKRLGTLGITISATVDLPQPERMGGPALTEDDLLRFGRGIERTPSGRSGSLA